MKVSGKVYVEMEVEPFNAIKSICQSIGIVNKEGKLIAEYFDNKIYTFWFDEFDRKHRRLLYDKSFDIQYASSLIKIYELSCNYLRLSEYIKNRKDEKTDDYQTAIKLKLDKYEKTK
jgi:GTP-sensing pleiotropic transcriptional regulator CodY